MSPCGHEPAAAAAVAQTADPVHWPRPAAWLPGGQAGTIWPALVSRAYRGPRPTFRRERWTTPDQDFVDADWLVSDAAGASAPPRSGRPVLVLFHGLEGSSRSPYALAFADTARRRGWDLVVPHFRGCSGEMNLAPRAYHSGDHTEIGWMLDQVRARHPGPLLAVGVSLGGNALLRWAQEMGAAAHHTARAVAAVCAPLDLTASGHAIGAGFNRLVYTRMFMRTLRPKALRKLAQHPGLFNRERLLAARDLYEFDNVVTAPLHGFRDADDYWRRASAKPHLAAIRVPALVVNPLDDPFVPAASLPVPDARLAAVRLWQPPRGGHVGFVSGTFPGHVLGMPGAVTDWLAGHL